MLNHFIPLLDNQYQALNIAIAESDLDRRDFLVKAIAKHRPYHKIVALDNIEEVFSLMYSEVAIDVILFDIEPLLDINNIPIINGIAPKIAFIHWSNCQHPEIIELLYSLGVNSFCSKSSNAEVLIAAIDSIVTNPNILYLDECLNECLPLLISN